jgi:hypothetical protein
MAITATISVNVSALPDNAIWFANSAAWSNYWSDITADVEVDAVANTIYDPEPYNNALQHYTLNVDGVDVPLATKLQIDSLIAQVAALDASYQQLRTEMRNAGYLENAQ